jgi:glucokinase
MQATLHMHPEGQLHSIGLAMPGPFDYERGIALFQGVAKYESLYGLNVGQAIRQAFPAAKQIRFANDAACAALGEYAKGAGQGCFRMIGLTLGTGIGSAFVEEGRLMTHTPNVPLNGYLYNMPLKGRQAEDYLSTRWFTSTYAERTGKKLEGVKELVALAQQGDPLALRMFEEMGQHLEECLRPWLLLFRPERVVLGGNISKAYPYFCQALTRGIGFDGPAVTFVQSSIPNQAAIIGVSLLTAQGLAP